MQTHFQKEQSNDRQCGDQHKKERVSQLVFAPFKRHKEIKKEQEIQNKIRRGKNGVCHQDQRLEIKDQGNDDQIRQYCEKSDVDQMQFHDRIIPDPKKKREKKREARALL